MAGDPNPDRISSRLAHELKTPLATMHGYAMTLLDQDLPEETRRWFLETIAREALRLSEIIDRAGEPSEGPPD